MSAGGCKGLHTRIHSLNCGRTVLCRASPSNKPSPASRAAPGGVSGRWCSASSEPAKPAASGTSVAARSRKPSKAKQNKSSDNGAVGMLSDGEEELLLVSRGTAQLQDEADLEQGVRFMDAVVKVYCVHTEPNYSLPWQRKRQFASTSSGFMVAGEKGERWLLTNAHSVEYYSQVKVKRRGDDQKFLAEVLAIGTECDIALLTVKDDAFWQDVQPLHFGPLPHLQDAVAVVGYPIGGDTISVTSGVVSRIEVTSYVHGCTELLGVQIDAAINSGNSGGPVFNSVGQCVGIAFQSMAGGDAENIGYVIPTPVIHHFLTDYRRTGSFTGFPSLGIKWQRMESLALRSWYSMGPGRKGVLVRHIAPTSNAAKLLKPDDVIMRFDGVQVACDGTVPFRSGERIAFNYLISQKYTGEHAVLDVLRDGAELQVDVTLVRPTSLVPLHLSGADPSFLVVAGLVFTPCCEPYLQSEYGPEYLSDSPVKLLDKLLHGHRQSEDEQVVILSQVLACDATLGYEDLFNVHIRKFNGMPIKNLRHLAQLVIDCKDKWMRFDMDYEEVVILDTEIANAATQAILEAHSIPAVVSKDMRDLLREPTQGLSPVLAAAADADPAAVQA
ncbi:hypothetical protein WJX72_005011 [[Myrmecia] bisecta]|uniref:Protease Do-like PDZ domain-containing protein n=1 Tax=[Myrmecia] bisecta TaxID=41462 RepID=A0AAW1QEY5_9CHLO